MGHGDLWGLESMVLIFYKSRLGFMGGPSVIRVPIGLAKNWLKRADLTKNTHLKEPLHIVILKIIINCNRNTILKRFPGFYL